VVGVFIQGGYSGAAVWDTVYEAVVGMVSATNTNPADRVAYMIPFSLLEKVWSQFLVEDHLQQLSANEPIRAAERAGWSLEQHPHFIGREWLLAERQQFIAQCEAEDHGGVMLVVGPPGVGKSALLTSWAGAGAPWPGYYFSFRETEPVKSMPEHIYAQIKHQLPADFQKPQLPDWTTKHFEAMLRDWSRANPSGRLLIFIDALDEAKENEHKRDGPVLAAQLIPKKVARRVFLIVSSRPAAPNDDHLRMLHCDHLKVVELTPEDRRNQNDVTRYFQTRLKDFLDDPGQADQLMEAAGGIFRLAVLMAKEIRSGKVTVRDILERAASSWGKLPVSEKLFGYYQDDLMRALDDDLKPYFYDFARLVVALQDWISEDEILRVLQHAAPRSLQWDEFLRDRIIRSFSWFLRSETRQRDDGERTVCYWPQHASVRDFLVVGTPSFLGPARSGVRDMHSRFGRCFTQLAEETGWSAVPYYGRLHAVRHLLQSGNRDDYRIAVKDLLCNPAYLQATLGDEPLESTERVQTVN
jgi:hypothetical protein